MTTLKEILKKRVMDDMVKFVQPAARWKIVIVDSNSLRIVNAVCTMHEILGEDVTIVESLERKRAPYPNLDAIYFVSATEESVKLMIDDFAKGKPPYAAAHIFFTSALNDKLFAKLKTSTLSKYIRNLKEMNVDFIAFEAQVFSFDNPNSFFTLYNASSDRLNIELDTIAKRLVSVMATLGEYPFIRFHDPTNQRTSLSAKLAKLLQNELDELCKVDSDFPPKSPFPPGTLIILDRGYDPIAPLLHEFTYQAMANDLLNFEGGSKYVYGYAEEDGSTVNKSVILDDNDSLWVQYRHTFIAEVTTGLVDQLNRFMSENKAAVASTGMKEGKPDLQQLKETLHALPEFQQAKAKFSTHINLAQECMKIFNKKRLMDVGNVEQCLATGETPDGTEPKNIVVDMMPLLTDPNLPSSDKVRLLMLYIISKQGIQDEDRRKFLDRAGLSLDESQSITNLSMLGVRLSKAEGVKKEKKPSKPRKKNKDGDVPYDLSRYIPQVKHLMEEQIHERLSSSLFPYIKDPPPSSAPVATSAGKTVNGLIIGGPGAGSAISLRTTKPSWAKKTTDRVSNDGNSIGGGEDLRKNGGRIILFILGGVTFSETRSAYEIMKELRRDVVIGSTHLLNPTTFIDSLKVLHRGVDAKLPTPSITSSNSNSSSAFPKPVSSQAGTTSSMNRPSPVTPTSSSTSQGLPTRGINIGAGNTPIINTNSINTSPTRGPSRGMGAVEKGMQELSVSGVDMKRGGSSTDVSKKKFGFLKKG